MQGVSAAWRRPFATAVFGGFPGLKRSNHLARFNSLFFQGEEELSSDSRIALTDSPSKSSLASE